MRLLIHDSSVLIDLISIDLLDKVISLPYVMETTDLVRSEILHSGQQVVLDRVIAARRLELIRSSIEEVRSIGALHVEIAALSLADCSILFHATVKRAAVLSGDALLRRTAKERSIPVHGTLWILNELVKNELLPCADACERLILLMRNNPRLPQSECQKLLDSWCAV